MQKQQVRRVQKLISLPGFHLNISQTQKAMAEIKKQTNIDFSKYDPVDVASYLMVHFPTVLRKHSTKTNNWKKYIHDDDEF